MTVCPIAIVSGCVKCPIFKVCPVKSLIGDYAPPAEKKAAAEPKTKSAVKPKAQPKAKSASKPAAKKKA
jgi:hypothetical protein